MLRTTGNNFEGYRVDEYIDVLSEEVIFKNSFFKRLMGSVGDFFSSLNILDTELKGATSLIENGKKYVMGRFTEKAERMGGNAILGIQFESSFGTDIIRIALSGTVVKISPDERTVNKKELRIPVKGTNDVPFKCSSVLYKKYDEEQAVMLDIFNPGNEDIVGIRCEVFFKSVFGGYSSLSDMEFVRFEQRPDRHLVSEEIPCKISKETMKSLDGAYIVVKKYISGEKVYEIETPEIHSLEDLKNMNTSSVSSVDIHQLIDELDQFETAKEIYEYVLNISQSNPDSIDAELVELLHKDADFERVYGNNKRDCMMTLNRYIQDKL